MPYLIHFKNIKRGGGCGPSAVIGKAPKKVFADIALCEIDSLL